MSSPGSPILTFNISLFLIENDLFDLKWAIFNEIGYFLSEIDHFYKVIGRFFEWNFSFLK